MEGNEDICDTPEQSSVMGPSEFALRLDVPCPWSLVAITLKADNGTSQREQFLAGPGLDKRAGNAVHQCSGRKSK